MQDKVPSIRWHLVLMKSWALRDPLDFIHSSKQGKGLESMLPVMTNADPFRNARFITRPYLQRLHTAFEYGANSIKFFHL